MLIVMGAVDFEQPRALWTKVFDDVARDHFVLNVAGNLGNVKSATIKARQRTIQLDFSRFSTVP